MYIDCGMGLLVGTLMLRHTAELVWFVVFDSRGNRRCERNLYVN
jgi:hypothetical protein